MTMAQIHGIISGEAPAKHGHQSLRNLETGERKQVRQITALNMYESAMLVAAIYPVSPRMNVQRTHGLVGRREFSGFRNNF